VTPSGDEDIARTLATRAEVEEPGTPARLRTVLRLLGMAAHNHPDRTWPQLVRLTCQYGHSYNPPVRPREVEALYALRVCDLFDPASVPGRQDYEDAPRPRYAAAARDLDARIPKWEDGGGWQDGSDVLTAVDEWLRLNGVDTRSDEDREAECCPVPCVCIGREGSVSPHTDPACPWYQEDMTR
jgi:hypothetical protein